MQSGGMEMKGLIFSNITLIVRDILGCASSPTTFALPSRWLRSVFEMAARWFYCCYRCNSMIVRGLCFLPKKGSKGGGFLNYSLLIDNYFILLFSQRTIIYT